MCCAYSSKWGLFGHNTRSAFRRTPSRSKFFVVPSSAPPASGSHLVATFAQCSTYYSTLEKYFKKTVNTFSSTLQRFASSELEQVLNSE